MPEEPHEDLLAWTRHSRGAPSISSGAGLLALNGYLRSLLKAKGALPRTRDRAPTSAGRAAPVAAGADPGRLDVLRKSVCHASFGHGIHCCIHCCIGSPLTRLEAAIALRVLPAHLPDVWSGTTSASR